MTLTLEIADEEQRLLAQKAAAAGLDVQSYVQRIMRVAAARPPIVEVLRPVRDAFRASRMTDEQLAELLEKAKHEMRVEREPRRG